MILANADFWHDFYFLLFALLTCGFAMAVVFSANVVRMAFYLVLCLACSSGLFFLAGAEFVGAMQLMIYVGGTLVLLIFGVMLTARANYVNLATRGGEWVMSLIVGGSLLFLLASAATGVVDWSEPNPERASVSRADLEASTPIGLAFTGLRVDKADQPDAVLRNGMSGYLLPFVIVSVHLLVVLVGAAYMARTKRRNVLSESVG